jgi:tetratricopeptide (TPR) repeat protein
MGNNNSTTTSSKSRRISSITAVTTTTLSSVKNKEDVTLIWLDKTIDPTRTTLREITNYVLLYTELESCITYIRSIRTERIFLIISGIYAEQCLNQIHDLPQLDSIFIYCMNINKYKNVFLDSEKYSKLIGIFDNENRLIESIREELNDLYQQLTTFSLYKNQKSTRDLSIESASFLWFQLFKDILLQIPRSNQAKKGMIEQCKQYYRGNNEELRSIDEFERTSDTIRWYTKHSFIYRLCNKALRTEDIELLYTFRYYIQDLCQCLATEHSAFKKRQANESIIIVYRGLKLTKDELKKFESNIGALISTNGFLSTTRNYNLALDFALKTSKRSIDVLPTLFIIETDIHIEHAVFADISSLSVYPNEQEILFDIGCAFKINQVHFDDQKNVWIVNMSLSNDARQILETYIEANRSEMEKGNIFLLFGLLLIEMGQYNQAEIYFENLLSSNIVNDEISLYTNIGRVKYLKGQYDEALKDFKTVYDLQRQQINKNDIDFARTMSNLGLIYMEQKKYDLALDYLFDVLKIYKKNPHVDKLQLANTDNTIGVIFNHKHDYDHALEYLFYAMKFYEEYLPTTDHPLMATNYNTIGLVFYYIREYQHSLNYCLKSFQIREKVLPINHPSIGDSCNNLALIYQQLHEYKQALDLFQLSLLIYENNPEKKMNIPICFNNIGLLCIDQKNFDQAIIYYLKALDYYNDQDQKKYQDEIGYTLDILGVAHEMKGDFEQALKYYKQSLECQQQNQNKFVQILIKMGNIHQKNGEYDQALDYYQQGLRQSETISADLLSKLHMGIGIVYHRQNKYGNALANYKQSLSTRKKISSLYDLDLAWIYNNVGCLYVDLADFNRALKYQKKAYDIRKKFLPSTHPDLATSLSNLGRIHQILAYQTNQNSNEIQQALENYKAAFHIRRKSLPIDHPDLAISYYNLALIHFDQREYEQCYVETQKALNIQRKIFSSNHPHLQQTLKLSKQIQIMLDYHKK